MIASIQYWCQRVVISQNWLSYGVIRKQEILVEVDFKWSSGFWIVNANSVIRSLIYHCVTCTSLRGKLGEQLMSELPSDRLQESPPFTYCGVDLFGPFTIKIIGKNGKGVLHRFNVYLFMQSCNSHWGCTVVRNWFFCTFAKKIYRETR